MFHILFRARSFFYKTITVSLICSVRVWWSSHAGSRTWGPKLGDGSVPWTEILYAVCSDLWLNPAVQRQQYTKSLGHPCFGLLMKLDKMCLKRKVKLGIPLAVQMWRHWDLLTCRNTFDGVWTPNSGLSVDKQNSHFDLGWKYCLGQKLNPCLFLFSPSKR